MGDETNLELLTSLVGLPLNLARPGPCCPAVRQPLNPCGDSSSASKRLHQRPPCVLHAIPRQVTTPRTRLCPPRHRILCSYTRSSVFSPATPSFLYRGPVKYALHPFPARRQDVASPHFSQPPKYPSEISPTMSFFQGTLQEGIATAVQQSKSVLCFVTGNSASTHLLHNNKLTRVQMAKLRVLSGKTTSSLMTMCANSLQLSLRRVLTRVTLGFSSNRVRNSNPSP